MQGKTINGFVLQRLLGKGGMAEVWYAENEIGMKAAVKIMSEMLAHNPVMQERFLNEAKVMVKLDHPNIRKVYGYGNVDDRPAIIMEYLDGTDLKMKMKSGERFTEEELEKWWNQLADALNYTHAQDVVHRDIKPSNIFIDQNGNAKLLDFGIAKVTDTSTGTQTGSTLGTRIYMSPEQVKDPKRVGTASDVYSLAVSFVHLLSGKAPYDSTTSSDYDIQVNIVTKPVDMSEVPTEWQRFLTPYLNKEADQRPALRHFSAALTEAVSVDEDGTVADMEEKQTLTPEKPMPQVSQKGEPVAKKEGKEPTKKTPASESSDKPKSRKGLWIALAVILLAAAAVVVWLLMRDPYKQIDQWISESERIYGAFNIDTIGENYTSAVDSLNYGFDNYIQALQAMKELELKSPDSLEFATRMRKCDSLDSLYVCNIRAIVDKELIRFSIADDTMAAVARLHQLTDFHYYSFDSVGCAEKEAVDREIDFLLNTELFIYGNNGKYGFIDQSGNKVIEAIYEAAEDFYEGLARVRVNGKYGFINKMGYQIIEPRFENAANRFYDGLAWIKYDGKVGYVDRFGTLLGYSQYGYVNNYYDGLAKVKIDNKWAFIDTQGKTVINPVFDNVGYFYEGLAYVEIDGKYGFMDHTGKIVIVPRFTTVEHFSEGMARVGIDGKYGYIDTTGKIVVNMQYDAAHYYFHEGMAGVGIRGKFGFVNNTGTMVIGTKYDAAGQFCEGLAWVRINDKYGYINNTGVVVVDLKYENAGAFSNGLAYVKVDEKYGYIDHSGKMVIEAKYSNAYNFSKGLAKVRLGDKYYYIDKQGNIVFEW